MIKNKVNGLDLTVYSEKLKNGLQIFVVPMENINNIYATFSTKFGSITDTFVPIGEEEMVTVPLGVAHFLEHKLFEQEDGVDPFSFFAERGADANANTSNTKTTYLFKGPEHFEENMNYLLDYVQKPYFTDENVLKEKGIIEQEYAMYQDDPITRLYEGLLKNLYIENSVKYPIVGTKKSIYEITKEDLFKCYNTFYHPSNMFVVVTGNVDPEKTIGLIKNNQNKKDYPEKQEIAIKNIIEPKGINKKKETIEMDVSIPKVALGYKINTKNIDISKFELRCYLNAYVNLKFDATSSFNEKIIEQGIVTEGVGIEILNLQDTSFIMIGSDTVKTKELINSIKKEMLDFNLTSDDLERYKKVCISNNVFATDNLNSVNSAIMNNIITYGEILFDRQDRIRNLNMKDFKKVIDSINFDDVSEYIINPKK